MPILKTPPAAGPARGPSLHWLARNAAMSAIFASGLKVTKANGIFASSSDTGVSNIVAAAGGFEHHLDQHERNRRGCRRQGDARPGFHEPFQSLRQRRGRSNHAGRTRPRRRAPSRSGPSASDGGRMASLAAAVPGKLGFGFIECGSRRRMGRKPLLDSREIWRRPACRSGKGQKGLELVAARHLFAGVVFCFHGHPLSKPAASSASPSFLRA